MGYLYKYAVDLNFIRIPVLTDEAGSNVIVSLTSYGRRVEKSIVYYTLISLLRQTRQPKKIILWLADDEWNDNSIPLKIRELKSKGIEICYCKDIKSYKKLIPTLKQYPDSTIITVDDDMIYSKDTIETLLNMHIYYPNDIICTVAKKPIIKNGVPCKYSEWEDSSISPFENNYTGTLLFPVGVGGVLYPPGCLHEDVTKEELFMRFCPKADDVWFWFCGLRKETTKRFAIKKGYNLTFDNLYQFFHKGSALTHSNNDHNQNDIQIDMLFEHYRYIL